MLPLQLDGSVQDKVLVEPLGVVRYRYDLHEPGARFAKVRQQVADGVCPKRVLSHAATLAIAFLHALALRTELLQADMIGNV
jgi:hypothetical protein